MCFGRQLGWAVRQLGSAQLGGARRTPRPARMSFPLLFCLAFFCQLSPVPRVKFQSELVHRRTPVYLLCTRTQEVHRRYVVYSYTSVLISTLVYSYTKEYIRVHSSTSIFV